MDAMLELKNIMQELTAPQIKVIKAFKLIYTSNLSQEMRKKLFICFANEFATTGPVPSAQSQFTVSQHDITLALTALLDFVHALGETVMNNLIALKVSKAPFEQACEVMFNIIEDSPTNEMKLGAFMSFHMTPYLPYSLPHLEVDNKESPERKKDAEYSAMIAEHLIDKMTGGPSLYFGLLSLLKLYDGKLEQQVDVIAAIFQSTFYKTRAGLISLLMDKLQTNHAALTALQEVMFSSPQSILDHLSQPDAPVSTMQGKKDLPN